MKVDISVCSLIILMLVESYCNEIIPSSNVDFRMKDNAFIEVGR